MNNSNKLTKITHPSNSNEQVDAETWILSEFNKQYLTNLEKIELVIKGNVKVNFDGIDVNNKIVCEIYSHQGKLKSAQKHKVSHDILKLITIEKEIGGTWRKLLIFSDEQVSRIFSGKSWVSSSISLFNIEIVTLPLLSEHREILLSVQKRQRMINENK